MRAITTCFLIIGLIASPSLHAKEDTAPPEAQPVVVLLEAAKNSNAAAFKNIYSRRIREDSKQNDWFKNVNQARSNLTRIFGNYALENFSFNFIGTDNEGVVTTLHHGVKSLQFIVIKEGNEWKLDER